MSNAERPMPPAGLRGRLLTRGLLYAGVLLAVLYLTAPFLWLVSASLMTQKEQELGRLVPSSPAVVARAIQENYRPYLAPDPNQYDIGYATARSFRRALLNSTLIAGAVTLLNLIFGSLAAYGLARIPTRANLALLLFYLVSRSVPAVAIMIPMYLLVHRAGLLDTLPAIIAAHTTFTLPFTIWLLRGYFHTVPVDLERAARVDGCTRMQALWRVFLPVTVPGLVAAGVFSFIFSWGEFLFALLFSTTMASKPVTVVASEFVAEIEIPFPLIAAGGVLAVILPVILAFVFQKFIQGGFGGAVTG